MSEHPGLRVFRRAPASDGVAASAPIAVLVHGSMDRASSFKRLATHLSGWVVITYDRRGYAGSSHSGPPRDFSQQVSDLVEVLEGTPVTVAFGHSYGGDVVLAAAAEHPELIPAAVVWEPPQPWLPSWPATSPSRGAAADMHPEEAAEWFMRRMVGDRVWERLPESTRSQRRGEGVTLQAEIAAFEAAAPFRPEDVRIPVIVGRGGRSQTHHRRSTRELASLLPRGELSEIADAGHGAHLSHPGEVADLIVRAAASPR